jgi:PAS domain S-box-containing protein
VTRILGYEPEERIGQSLFELVHPDDLHEIQTLFQRVLKETDLIVKGEARIKHKDGSWRWMEGVGHNLLNEPNINAIIVNCRDSTEQKAITQQLKQNEEKFRLLVETTNVIPWEADINTFQFTYVGPQAERILGYPLNKWYTTDFWIKHIHPQDRDFAVQYCLEKSKTKKDYEFEYRMMDSKGNTVWFKDIVGVLAHDNGLLRGFLIDITEQRLKEEKIKEYSRKLKESNKELEQFAFVASHDLQEPLRIISSYAYLLTEKYKTQLEPVVDKYLKYIVTNTGRMQEMINSLLEYSRLGKRKNYEEKIDAGEVCDLAIANLAILIKRKKAKVTRDDLPVVFGNKVELIRLFQNLINNAIKYCDKNTASVHIGITNDNNNWIFSVEDNGIGIDEEYYNQIFEVFKRLHTKSDYSGSGMGLSICKKIVEQNGGQIWVQSKPKMGSQFYFTLPKRKEVVHDYEYHTT